VSRRYLEPVQVRTCTSESDSEPTTEFDAQARPRDFLWRGRRYVVRTVVAHWIEGGSWWRRPERSGERQTVASGGRVSSVNCSRRLRPQLRSHGQPVAPRACSRLTRSPWQFNWLIELAHGNSLIEFNWQLNWSGLPRRRGKPRKKGDDDVRCS